MAHFAKVSPTNIVEQVVVISNSDILDANGVEQETLGIAVCHKIFGAGTWVQTSFNGNFNGEFAQPGYIYSPAHKTFRSPEPPFPSWTVGADSGVWEAPTPKFSSDFMVAWDEPNLCWREVKTIKFVNGVENSWDESQGKWLVWDEESQQKVPATVQEPPPNETV